MFTKKSRKGGLKVTALLLSLILILPFTLGPMARPARADSGEPPYNGEPTTALQIELAEAISQRQAEGLPIPEITFNAASTQEDGFSTFRTLEAEDLAEETTTTTATTVIYFDGPDEAGYEVWPDLEITGVLAGDDANSFTTGNLTEAVRTGVENQDPDFWEQVEFGKEAREYTITETTEVTPGSGLPPTEMSLMSSMQASSPELLLLDSTLPSTTEDILMGFTFTGPHIRYIVEQQVKACAWLVCVELAYIKAGFELDWALGLRLPAEVTLSQGDDTGLAFKTNLNPLDWSQDEYTTNGVAPEKGNEFLLRIDIFAGVQVRVIGLVNLGYYIDLSKDSSKSFETPFGDNDPFSIGSFTIPLITLPVNDDDENNNGSDNNDDGLVDSGIFEVSIGLEITPTLSSNKIKADWYAEAGDDCSEKGTVEYNPNTAVDIVLQEACFSKYSSSTQVKVDKFRYYFNQFSFEFGAATSITVLEWIEIDLPTIHLFTLNLNKIFPKLDEFEFLYLGDHVQCNYLFKCGRVGPDNILGLGSFTPPPDTTPPVITPIIEGTLGDNGWYTSKIILSWDVSDSESEITEKNGCDLVTIENDQETTEYACEATSEGGYDIVTVNIKRDASPPQLTCPIDGPFLLNSGEHVVGPVDADATISGLNDDLSILEGIVPTENIGPTTIIFAATDKAGNYTSISCSYDVFYNSSAFLPPVEAMNAGKAGRTYPIKWQLTDANGTYIGDLSAITSIAVHPSTLCSIGETESTLMDLNSDESTWRYDSIDNQYIYNWRTPTSPGCYALVVTLDSGQKETAIFALK